MSQQQSQSIIKSCPWDQFLDSKRFKIPAHFADVKPRAIANLKENNFNYILISSGILAAGCLFHKAFVITILLSVALSFVLFYLDQQLSSLVKRELELKHKLAALVLGIAFFLLVTHSIPVFKWCAILISFTVLLHLTIFDPVTTSQQVNFPSLFGGVKNVFVPRGQINTTPSTATKADANKTNTLRANPTVPDYPNTVTAGSPSLTPSKEPKTAFPNKPLPVVPPRNLTGKAQFEAVIQQNLQQRLSEPATSPKMFHPSPTVTPVTSTSGPESVKSVKSDKPDKRFYIVKEMVDTEDTYCQNLSVMRDVYMTPLLVLANQLPSIKPEDLKIIFSSSEVISNYSAKLLEELRERLNAWNNDRTKVGDIFLRMAAFLKTYHSYITNYTNAIRTLQKIQKIPEVQVWMEERDRDPRNKNLDLSSYLIMPVQRIPRYMLLIEQLIKNTDKNHPDYHDLVESKQKIDVVAQQLNEADRDAENMNKTFRIQEKLSGDFETLVEPSRRLIKEGALQYYKPKDMSKPHGDRYFYLFNDVLLHVKLSKKIHKKNSIGGAVTPQELTATAAPKLQFKEQFSLGKEVALSDMDGQQFALVDGSDWTKRLAVLEAKNPSEKKEWVKAIEDCTAETSKKKRFFEDNINKAEKRRVSGGINVHQN